LITPLSAPVEESAPVDASPPVLVVPLLLLLHAANDATTQNVNADETKTTD
jgi:hypothetical protein